MTMKIGRFTVSEINFINQNAEKMLADEIGQKLNRDPGTIARWIEKNIGTTKEKKVEIENQQELKNRPYYRELEKQFSREELELFNFHFRKMWSQFKEDVFHTEEMQIIDYIKTEILMNRILRAQQETMDNVAQTERDIAREKSLPQPDNIKIDMMNRQVAIFRSAIETMSKDYRELHVRKSAMQKDLKVTRDQRIDRIEDSKQTFASLIKKLTMDPQFRKAVGTEMEAFRLAAEQERKRLSKVTEYDDGTFDRPLLSKESVFLEE